MSDRTIKGRVGVFVIFVLLAVPVVLWFTMRPIGLRFENSFMTLTSIGQIAGLLGITLFSLTLILSARLHFLEEYFGGLDRIYNVHHISGTIAFVLLLIHPLVLAVKLIPFSVVEAARFLIPGGDWAVNFGIFSLLLMMTLLIITFFARWRYQWLRFLHQILGAAFFLGALHAFVIPSDISQNILLRYYVLGLAAAALVAYAYRTLLGKVLVQKYTYIVSAVHNLGLGVTEVVMTPDGEKMHYLPGQFIFISFVDGGMNREVHPFTISSSPTEPVLRITVKALGDWTTELKHLNIGAVAKIEGPFGHFSYLSVENKNQIWIAGGIGVTPFLNMLRNLRVNKRSDLHVDFYYSTKTENEIVFRKEIEDIVTENRNIRFIPFVADKFGFLTAKAVEKISGELPKKDIFVCGPPPMMHSLITQFKALHVSQKKIHAEAFKLL